MREKGLTIMRGTIPERYSVDGDALFGQPDNARFMTPEHPGPGFHHGVVIGRRVVAVILPGKIVQDLKLFTVNGIKEVLIVRMNLMDERGL